MQSPRTIKNDEDGWSLLKELLSYPDDTPEEDLPEVLFEGWPILNIQSQKGESQIDALTMRGLIKYQEAVWRSYLTLAEGTRNLQRIGSEDKLELLLPVHVGHGSSKFDVDLTEVLKTVAKKLANKLTARDILILVIGTGFLFAGQSVWKTHISENAKVRIEKVKSEDTKQMLEAFVNLSQQETERLKVLQDAFHQVPETKVSEYEANSARQDLLRSLPEDYGLNIEGIQLSPEVLQEIIKSERTPYNEVTVKRTYYIERASSADSGFQVRLVDTETDERFSAHFGEALSSVAERAAVQQAFFNKQPIVLTLDARKRGDLIMSAEIKKAEPVRP
ncbi:MAG: hypothetical protein KJ871_11370 [Alphaproteobacteria bacterium]|nr:hypothetical protein [Alphaproteobacteria bacterium]MBU2085484.1 hypothetical protein [Alphaproteobacteria bacterium]MBU2143448.1 hypothetical protein [Alphaproteobacteria bacterium]